MLIGLTQDQISCPDVALATRNSTQQDLPDESQEWREFTFRDPGYAAGCRAVFMARRLSDVNIIKVVRKKSLNQHYSGGGEGGENELELYKCPVRKSLITFVMPGWMPAQARFKHTSEFKHAKERELLMLFPTIIFSGGFVLLRILNSTSGVCLLLYSFQTHQRWLRIIKFTQELRFFTQFMQKTRCTNTDDKLRSCDNLHASVLKENFYIVSFNVAMNSYCW